VGCARSALLERHERLEAVLANIGADAQLDAEARAQHARDVEQAYVSAAEKQTLARHALRLARLLRAEARLDQLCLALRACLAHRPPPPAAPARRQAPKLIV